MGMFESFKSLLAGSGTRTLDLQLDIEEAELARATASHRPGSLRSVGGDLVLTTRRLVFTPLDTRDLVEVLTWSLGKSGTPSAATGVLNKMGDLVEKYNFGLLTSLTAAEAGSGPTLLKPPTIIVTSPSGSVEVGISSGRLSPNISSSNILARDRMLAAIQAQLQP